MTPAKKTVRPVELEPEEVETLTATDAAAGTGTDTPYFAATEPRVKGDRQKVWLGTRWSRWHRKR